MYSQAAVFLLKSLSMTENSSIRYLISQLPTTMSIILLPATSKAQKIATHMTWFMERSAIFNLTILGITYNLIIQKGRVQEIHIMGF